jgi:adenylate cyclase
MFNQNDSLPFPTFFKRNRLSAALLSILAIIALVVLAGLVAIAVQLINAQTHISTLRDHSLPRLVKLSQLSQESSASVAIAPSLSTNPTRFEFETLLARIEDKRGSQTALLSELGELITKQETLDTLRKNSALLSANQTALTTVVRQHINIRKRLEKHFTVLRRLSRDRPKSQDVAAASNGGRQQTLITISRLQSVLLDPLRARFSRNRQKILSEIDKLKALATGGDPQNSLKIDFLSYWSKQGDRIFEDKNAGLANAFKIKALVEENSLIANRLLSSANLEFVRANAQLTEQIMLIASATRFNLLTMLLVVLAFTIGALFLWLVLQRRVFRRLDNMRKALGQYAETRNSDLRDEAPDEIGDIARAISDYMKKIDNQEKDLQEKTGDLEKLSTRLAKYLSPQVYESIFSGKQKVVVSSTRKKLTVFFSDIVDFTQMADQLESEELTQLLNTYLTEMSQIALRHGATIDKYIGDAIMVFFGDPDTKGIGKDALRCVTMAIAMRERLDELNEQWKEEGISKPLTCRIGIHTGYCTVGNFGSEERMDYTIIGSTVNTASRLEKMADPGQILISYETFALVEKDVACEEQGQVDVKGIAYPIRTYSALAQQKTPGKWDEQFRESHAGIRIELDRDLMTSKDKSKALDALERAIRHINI